MNDKLEAIATAAMSAVTALDNLANGDLSDATQAQRDALNFYQIQNNQHAEGNDGRRRVRNDSDILHRDDTRVDTDRRVEV